MTNIFILLTTLMPFIVWKGYFEGPKVFAFLLFGLALSVYWILRLIKSTHSLKLEKKDAWFLLWLLVLTISSLLGIHPLDSILGGSYRHQGVIFFLTLWIIGKTAGLMDGKKKKLLYKGIGFAVIAESLIVFYQLIFGKLYLGKPLGTLGEANAVAGFLAMGSYFVFKSFSKIATLLPLTAILLTQSRSGILAIVPNFGYVIELLNKKWRAVSVVILGVISITVVSYISVVKSNLPFDTFESRQIIWPMAIQQIIKMPLLGYGAESGEVIFNRAFISRETPLSNLIIDRAHNIILDVTIWSGTIGLILFLGWLYFSYKDLKETGKKLAFLAFLIYAFFQPIGVVHWLLFILII